jgi:hypothetical protein
MDKNLLPHDDYTEFLTVLGIKSEVDIQLAFHNLTTFSQDVDREPPHVHFQFVGLLLTGKNCIDLSSVRSSFFCLML